MSLSIAIQRTTNKPVSRPTQKENEENFPFSHEDVHFFQLHKMSRGEGHRGACRHGHQEISTHPQQERKQADVSKREDIPTDFEMISDEAADFNIPSATPHPHFPCVAIMDSRVKNVMELVAIGIQNAADEVLWTSHPDRKNHDPCKVLL